MVSESNIERCAARTLDLKEMDCEIHISWREEQNISYKCVEISPESESSKRTISANGGLLQID